MVNVEISELAVGTAVDHAQASGLSLGEWITRAIAEQAAQQDADTAPDILFDDAGFPSFRRVA